ncbi:hypothetical protein MKA58_04670 [[Clostridium] innocuum]|nr:hypothetical protein [[Clostridium] innocuum]
MNILFTICGRAGSKGIINKNIREFCGYPLAYYSLSAIDLVKLMHSSWYIDVVVNSDSPQLIHMMKNNPFLELEIIKRRSELSTDNVPKINVIYDCLKDMESRKKIKYNMVIDLDITSPLRTVSDINNLIEVHSKTNADVTTSVTNSRRNPYFNMLKKTTHGYKKVLESSFTSRQEAPILYDMNASLYAYKPEFLKSGKGVLEGYCECIHMYDTGILDLDHENDFELMQVLASYFYRKYPEFAEIQEHIKEVQDVSVN